MDGNVVFCGDGFGTASGMVWMIEQIISDSNGSDLGMLLWSFVVLEVLFGYQGFQNWKHFYCDIMSKPGDTRSLKDLETFYLCQASELPAKFNSFSTFILTS